MKNGGAKLQSRNRNSTLSAMNWWYTTYNFNIHIIYLYSFLPKKKISNSNNTPLDTDTEHHHITITICEQTRKKLTISVKKLGES